MTAVAKTAHSIRHVLVIFPGALGDLMCLMPALVAISRRHAAASIELMARFELARLVAGRTVVARAHSIDAREVGALFTESGTESARRFFAEFDRIYSFFASDDRRFRARLAAATDAVVSFHPFRPDSDSDGHVSDAYLRAIDAAVLPADSRLEPTSDDLAAAARAIVQSECGSSNPVVVFPGSGSAAKNWPADKFAELAAMLTNRDANPSDTVPHPALKDERRPLPTQAEGKSCAVVLGPAETSLEPIFREAGVPVLKNLDLPTVAAIARGASAFVGNDSGASHLAAAVGASGVAIFGPTDPARWRPRGSGNITVLRREPIDSIEVREVADALAKFVASPQR
jgi:ADP-heptose:LPS heptosyltransferase